MPRTPEQKAADEALTEAIERVARAYDPEEIMSNFTPTEYIVLTSRQGWDEDGEPFSSIGVIYKDGDVPMHRALGLVEYVGARMRKFICEDDEE